MGVLKIKTESGYIPAGAWGPTGPTGPAGSAGAAGEDGRTILYGTGAPGSGTGEDGDFYIATDTHHLYGPKASGTWPAGTSLVGPTGPQGSAGAAGATGPQGPQGEAGTPAQVLTIDDPLDTMDDVTGESGTWAISSGVLRQSSTSDAKRIARHTALAVQDLRTTVEVELKIDSGSSSAIRAGILLPYSASAGQGGRNLVYLEWDGSSTWNVRIERGDQVQITSKSVTCSTGTWYKLRVSQQADDLVVWLDDAFLLMAATGASYSGQLVAFYTSASDSSFRNLKAWYV